MATFKNQIAGLIGYSTSATEFPSDSELTEFLSDAIKDVINRMISANPEEGMNFSTTTHDSSNSGVLVGGNILSVVREHDSTTILRPCAKISAHMRYEATDSESLNYMSKYNPGFYVLNGKVFTVPASASSDNDAIVTQVSYPEVTYANTSIVNFPDKYEYLVVLKSAMATIINAMSVNYHQQTTVSTTLTAGATAASNASTDLTKLKNELADAKLELETIGTLSKAEAALDKANKLFSDDAGFSALSDVTDDLSNSTSVSGWLEEEDPEMVSATINAIAGELKRADSEMKLFLTKSGLSKNYLDIATAYMGSIDGYIKEGQHHLTEASVELKEFQQNFALARTTYADLKERYDMAFMSEAQILERKRKQQQAAVNASKRRGRGRK